MLGFGDTVKLRVIKRLLKKNLSSPTGKADGHDEEKIAKQSLQ